VAKKSRQYLARVIESRRHGKSAPQFIYRHRGSMAIVGRAKTIADLGRIRLAGSGAWLAWLFVHLMEIVEFENRVFVLVQWAWFYFRRSRAARLITGDKPGAIHQFAFTSAFSIQMHPRQYSLG
jgi:NADH dehydrogenase